jgi:hypothetical protein
MCRRLLAASSSHLDSHPRTTGASGADRAADVNHGGECQNRMCRGAEKIWRLALVCGAGPLHYASSKPRRCSISNHYTAPRIVACGSRAGWRMHMCARGRRGVHGNGGQADVRLYRRHTQAGWRGVCGAAVACAQRGAWCRVRISDVLWPCGRADPTRPPTSTT